MTKLREARQIVEEMDQIALAEGLQQGRQELLQLRLQQATGQLEHHRRIREVRRTIARVLTRQGALERAEQVEVGG